MPKDDMKAGVILAEFVDKAYLVRMLHEYNFFTIRLNGDKFINVEQGVLDQRLIITIEDGDELHECAVSNNPHALYRIFTMLNSGELELLTTRR